MEGVEEGKEKERNSKDSRKQRKENVVKRIRESGWMIMNGRTEADKEGDWMYIGGRRESVIDYILGEEEIREEMGYLEIRDRIESDHHSVIAWMRKGERRRNGGGRKMVRKEVWDEGKKKLLGPG